MSEDAKRAAKWEGKYAVAVTKIQHLHDAYSLMINEKSGTIEELREENEALRARLFRARLASLRRFWAAKQG